MEDFELFDYLLEREMQQMDALMDNLEATLDMIVKCNRFVETYAALLKELDTALSTEEAPL